MFLRRAGDLRSDKRGNVTTVVALCAVPLLLAVFGVIELAGASNERQKLQEAVDAGALAGAGRLAIASTSGDTGPGDTAVAVARQYVASTGIRSDVAYTPTVSLSPASVTLRAVAEHRSLAGFMGLGDQQIIVHATAETLDSTPLCILQTGAVNKGGIDLDNTARIRATGCAVHANANITVKSPAMIQASRTQAVGTVTGAVSPAGNSGALAIPDPFAGMNLVPPTECNGKAAKIKQLSGTVLSLAPGVHCELFEVDKDATLILQPGEHYFMDDLRSKENAIIRGDDVVLIFGTGKKVNFADRAVVQLTARKTGTFAGFLIVTTRDNDQQFTIASDHVNKLLGTIYIPGAEMVVATAGNVAQDSAWSIIVANRLTMTQNPVLVINSVYTGSGVPVPDGVGPHSNAPRLAK